MFRLCRENNILLEKEECTKFDYLGSWFTWESFPIVRSIQTILTGKLTKKEEPRLYNITSIIRV